MSTMQGNTETPQPVDAGQPAILGIPHPDGTEAVAEPPPLTPPPPSAPGEFLYAQWLQTAGKGIARAGPGSLPVPPPPSAPSEFLDAQWHSGTGAYPEATPPAEDVFALALSPSVNTSEDLDLLQLPETDSGDETTAATATPGAEQTEERVRIRGVPLDSGETVTRVFLPNDGLADQVPSSGQAMILTSRRLIAFRGVEGYRDTHIARTSQITQSSVRTGQRNWGAVLQGLMIVVGGAILYLVVGYWLAGQISGPQIPVLSIDIAPFIALLIILAGVFILLQNYFTRPAGAVVFHGLGVEIAFPFRSSLDVGQVYIFVDLVHKGSRSSEDDIGPQSPKSRSGPM